MHRNIPDFVDARDHVSSEIIRLTRELRKRGAAIHPSASLDATRALVEVGLDDRRQVAIALRVSILVDKQDYEHFEALFPQFWYRLRTGLEAIATGDHHRLTPSSAVDTEVNLEGLPNRTELSADAGNDGSADIPDRTEPLSIRVADEADDTSGGSRDTDDRTSHIGTTSRTGSGTDVESPEYSPPDRLTQQESKRFLQTLSTVRKRRSQPTKSGQTINLRRTVRRALTTGGVPLSLTTQSPKLSGVRLCIIVDVSQSVLDAIDRSFLLRFLSTCVATGSSIRIFFFDTAIQEVTEAFSATTGDPHEALKEAEVSWGGGTQIGASLTTLRTTWPEAIDFRTATIIISDGLEVGDIDQLAAEIIWLSRRSGPFLWFNPLAASPDFSPTCRGMELSVPYIDGLFAFSGPADLEDITEQLERHGHRGTVGYEYDFRQRSRSELSA